MAEYLPPTEDLPKFNEFVFDDAYSIEGLDRRVVHKAGTETITGNKTFTGTITATNTTTSLTATTKNELESFTGLNSLMNTSGNNTMTTFSGSNQMVNTSGFNSLTNDSGDNNIITDSGDNNIESKNGSTFVSAFDKLRFWGTTMSFGYDTLFNRICSVMSFESLGGMSFGFNLDGLGSGNFNISDNLTSFLSIDNVGMYLTNNEVYVDGNSLINITSSANKIQNTAGSNLMTALTTGTNTIQSVSGKNSITSTTGQIELKTGGTSLTSINIENTSATSGGITMKTSGTSGISISSTSATGDIGITSGDNINLTTTGTGGDILITSASTSTSQAIELSATAGGINITADAGDINITAGAGNDIINTGNFYSANYYRIGTQFSNVPICSFILSGTATSNATAGNISWNGTVGASELNKLDWTVFPFRVRLQYIVLMFDADGTASGTIAFSFQVKTTNAGTAAVRKSQNIAYATNTSVPYTQVTTLTGTTAANTWDIGDFLYLSYTAAPGNEWGVILYGFQY
jgi:hypothetical protein